MNHGWQHIVGGAAGAAVALSLSAVSAAAQSSPATVPTASPIRVAAGQLPSLVVEMTVTDKKGAPAQNLQVTDFDIVVDGQRRAGLALGPLYRGPGAEFEAATSETGGPGQLRALTEPRRIVVLVIDQSSFSPGDERAAKSAAESWIDLLSLGDRVTAVTLPTRSSTTTISFDRSAVAKTLATLQPMWDHQFESADTLAARDDLVGRDVDRPQALIPGAERTSAERLRAHAAAALAGLRDIARALEPVPGGKTILFVSTGLVATGLGRELDDVVTEAARVHARIMPVQVPSASALRDLGQPDLQRLAQETGGHVVGIGGSTKQTMERIATDLSFSYLLVLAPMPGDGAPTPHAVAVTLRQHGGLSLRAPSVVLPGRIAPDDLAAALSLRPTTPTAKAPPAERVKAGDADKAQLPGFGLFSHDRSVDHVLARVSQYASDYGRELSSVVSEETYQQEVRDPSAGKGTAVGLRTLVSDYLLVSIPGMDGWLPFRDVFEVDGKPVRDREDRLLRLFLQTASPDAALDRANQIMAESARYNLGPVLRNLNVPTLALWFLEPANARRFAYRKAGEEKAGGRQAWVLEFTESVRPTFVKSSTGEDVPVRGRVWVDPLNGQILQTRISALSATITVRYTQRPEVPGLWLPESMQETYASGRLEISATAVYAKYRRFQVLTSEQVVAPKK